MTTVGDYCIVDDDLRIGRFFGYPCLLCSMRIQEAVEKYLNKKRADKTSKDCFDNKVKVLNKMVVYFDDCNLSKINIDKIFEFINTFSSTEIANWRDAINVKVFLKFLSERELLSIPYTLIDTKCPSDRIRPHVTEIEFKLIDEACHTLIPKGREYDRWHFMIHFMWETGLRRDEVLGLRRKDIDFKNKTFTVTGKNKKTRRGYYLTDLLPYVFRFKPGEKMFEMSKRQTGYMVNRLKTLADIDKSITPHSFRHGYTTRLINNGMDVPTCSRLLGHAKLETTMRYWHSCDQELQNAYDQYSNTPKVFEITSKLGRKQKYKIEFKITKNK